jgi:general secretion pathway protein G
MAYCAYCGNPLAEVSHAPCPHCGNPSNGAPRRGGVQSKSANTAAIVIVVVAGFFVLIAIIGILAAIAIPNFLTAQQRARQKRTMADMRSIGTAIEAYATQHDQYPRANSIAELAPLLVPAYAQVVPWKDGWGHDLRYQCWPEEDACSHYALGSPGKDGAWEHDSVDDYVPDTATTNFDADIIWIDGNFVQYPEGMPRP